MSGLGFDGTHIWASSRTQDAVRKFDPATGQILGTYEVGDSPDQIVFDGTHIWVANSGDGTITKLVATSGELIGTYDVGRNPTNIYGAHYSGLAFDGTYLWVTNDNASSVSQLRAIDGSLVAVHRAGSGPSRILFDGTHLWVTNRNLRKVSKIWPSTGATVGSYDTGANPLGMAYDGAHVWVVNNSSKTVSKISASSGALIGTYPTDTFDGHKPLDATFDGTHIWVTHSDDGGSRVTRIRAADGVADGVFDVGSGPNYAGFDGTHVWIGSSDGVATRITPANSSTTTMPTPTTAPPATSTTIPAYTHPSAPRNVQAGDPVTNGEIFSVELSWNPPAESGSSAIENHEIRQAYHSETESWTVGGAEFTTTAASLSPARQYSFEVRAVNQDGRAGPWSDKIYVAIPSLLTTDRIFDSSSPTANFDNHAFGSFGQIRYLQVAKTHICDGCTYEVVRGESIPIEYKASVPVLQWNPARHPYCPSCGDKGYLTQNALNNNPAWFYPNELQDAEQIATTRSPFANAVETISFRVVIHTWDLPLGVSTFKANIVFNSQHDYVDALSFNINVIPLEEPPERVGPTIEFRSVSKPTVGVGDTTVIRWLVTDASGVEDVSSRWSTKVIVRCGPGVTGAGTSTVSDVIIGSLIYGQSGSDPPRLDADGRLRAGFFEGEYQVGPATERGPCELRFYAVDFWGNLTRLDYHPSATSLEVVG